MPSSLGLGLFLNIGLAYQYPHIFFENDGHIWIVQDNLSRGLLWGGDRARGGLDGM